MHEKKWAVGVLFSFLTFSYNIGEQKLIKRWGLGIAKLDMAPP